jgi:hypothetical protein
MSYCPSFRSTVSCLQTIEAHDVHEGSLYTEVGGILAGMLAAQLNYTNVRIFPADNLDLYAGIRYIAVDSRVGFGGFGVDRRAGVLEF